MGRYKTRDTDERGELILVPEIPDHVATGGESMNCNFCVFHENRDTGEIMRNQVADRCGYPGPGGCRENFLEDRIFIYRHELQEYKARALVAKINRAREPERVDS
jgi:hypothetical protein